MGTHDLRLTLLPELDGIRLPPIQVMVPTDTLLRDLAVFRLVEELEEVRYELSRERRRRGFPWRRRKP